MNQEQNNLESAPTQNSNQLRDLSAIYLWPTMILLASVIISLAWVYTARLKTNQTASFAPATTAATLPVQSRPSTGCNL